MQQAAALRKGKHSDYIDQTARAGSILKENKSIDLGLLVLVPWGHHLLIMDKVKTLDEARFYLHQIVQHNWTRTILTSQIEQGLFHRSGTALTNFETTLPKNQAALATEILKDPYNFGFLTLEPKVQELEVKKS